MLREKSGGEGNDDRIVSRKKIVTVNYDTLNRPANGNSDDPTDGDWDVANPVDFTTGLWYENPNNVKKTILGGNTVGDGNDSKGVDDSTGSNSNNGNGGGPDDNNTANGGGTDWSELIPTFLDHGYTSSLGYKSVNDANVPLLMIERSYNPPPIRQQVLEILFEECEVPATFMGRDATMACYACGRTTSTVIDIGYSGTTVSPVFEGYVEQKGIRRSPVGTLAMDEFAFKRLDAVVSAQQRAVIRSSKKKGASSQKPKGIVPLYQARYANNNGGSVSTGSGQNIRRHPIFHRLSLLDIAREGREAGACQSINTSTSKTLAAPNISYQLPDGTMVDVPSRDRFAVANLVVGKCGTSATSGGAAGEGTAGDATSNATDPSAAEDTEEEATQRLREEYLAKTRRDYDLLLKRSMESKKEQDSDDGDKMDVDDDDDDDDDAKKKEASKYTDATAVGISSRRSSSAGGRGGKKNAPGVASTTSVGRRKVMFNNQVLQKACLPYLQTCFEDELTASCVANMVCDAAFRCDREQQAGVLGNVVLAGGGSCIGPTDQSVPDYIRDQMEAIIHVHTPGWKVRVLSPGMQERAVASWLGGSILGSLGTFHDMWITKADYEEWGSAIVNRKCP